MSILKDTHGVWATRNYYAKWFYINESFRGNNNTPEVY